MTEKHNYYSKCDTATAKKTKCDILTVTNSECDQKDAQKSSVIFYKSKQLVSICSSYGPLNHDILDNDPMNKHGCGTSEINLVECVRIISKEYPIHNTLMKRNHLEGRPGPVQTT